MMNVAMALLTLRPTGVISPKGSGGIAVVVTLLPQDARAMRRKRTSGEEALAAVMTTTGGAGQLGSRPSAHGTIL